GRTRVRCITAPSATRRRTRNVSPGSKRPVPEKGSEAHSREHFLLLRLPLLPRVLRLLVAPAPGPGALRRRARRGRGVRAANGTGPPRPQPRELFGPADHGLGRAPNSLVHDQGAPLPVARARSGDAGVPRLSGGRGWR